MGTFVTYAQNFEDVMLWRAFGTVARGFYIDVGASDPDRDSVTRAFYERGWTGIDIDPAPDACEALRARRPHDVVLDCAVGADSGEADIHYFAGTGLSTLSADHAARHAAERGLVESRVSAPMRTLADICAEHAPEVIHFLKIDVEGSERAVLLGADFTRWRPRVVLVEATEPNSRRETWEQWESILIDAGYRFVWFDGLNRFYVAQEHVDALAPHFTAPPNVFDRWSLPETQVTRDVTHAVPVVSGAPDSEALKARLALLEAAEETRRNAEHERTLQEQARQLAERMRGDAEVLRHQTERLRGETELRWLDGERQRGEAEAVRQAAEHGRGVAERGRQEAEGMRGEAEQDRQLQELARTENEAVRQDHEKTRMMNERARLKAERERGKQAAEAPVAPPLPVPALLPDSEILRTGALIAGLHEAAVPPPANPAVPPPVGRDLVARARRVAGRDGAVSKKLSRVAIYGAVRVAARLPGASLGSRVAGRVAPGASRWVDDRYRAYRRNWLGDHPSLPPGQVGPIGPSAAMSGAVTPMATDGAIATNGVESFEESSMLIRLRARTGRS